MRKPPIDMCHLESDSKNRQSENRIENRKFNPKNVHIEHFDGRALSADVISCNRFGIALFQTFEMMMIP